MTDIALAILKGALLYVVGGLLIVHVFVALKWETANADGRYTVDVVTNPEIPKDLLQWKERLDKNVSDAPSIQELQKMRDVLLSTPTHRGGIMEEAFDILLEYEAHLNEVMENDTEWEELLLPEGDDVFEELNLNNLLGRKSLSNLTEDEMDTLLNATIRELQQMADQASTAQWSSLAKILFPKSPFPGKERIKVTDLEEEICTLPAFEEEDEDEEEDPEGQEDEEDEDTAYLAKDRSEAELDQLYVQEEDLEAYFEKVESLLEDRAREPTLHLQNRSFIEKRLPNITDELNGHIQTAYANLAASIEEISENIAEMEYPREENSDCEVATEDDVFLFLETGLAAVQNRLDIREALMEVFAELDPEAAENLILDADLSTDPPLPRVRAPEQVSLLKLLNSPLLGKLSYLADYCLDGIGGYVDSLDHFLDSQGEKYVDKYNQDASSLGKVYVVYLLVQSGHLNIPLPAPLRDFLESKSRGRALLESLA